MFFYFEKVLFGDLCQFESNFVQQEKNYLRSCGIAPLMIIFFLLFFVVVVVVVYLVILVSLGAISF